MSNWYDHPNISSERVVLAKKIKFVVPKDLKAEFLLPVMTPTNKDSLNGKSTNVKSRAPSKKSQISAKKLDAKKYTTSNNVELTIPKHIVAEFFDEFAQHSKIPKGTQFIATVIGEKTKADEMRIVGYYELGKDKKK